MHDQRGVGVREFCSVTRHWVAYWDSRRETMVFGLAASEMNKQHLHLRLDSFENYRCDVLGFSSEDRGAFEAILQDWPAPRCGIDDADLIRPIERLAFLRAQFALASNEAPNFKLDRLIAWLMGLGSSASWLQRYDTSLLYAYRYKLLRSATRAMAAARSSDQAPSSEVDASDQEMRQNFWFALRMQCDLAEEWCRNDGFRSPEAQTALREAHLDYLQVLKGEVYRRELDLFLDQMREGRRDRTGSEAEVARLLHIDKELNRREPSVSQSLKQDRRRSDKALDLKFFSWFLERYDMRSARILMWRGLPDTERLCARICVGLVLLAAFLFCLQGYPTLPGIPIYKLGVFQPSRDGIWIVQSLVQGVALFLAAWLSPAFFNMVLPRALFGSLVTWITLIFTSIPGLWAIETEKDHPLREACHQFLRDHGYSSLPLLLPCLLLALVFVMREIGQWTDSRRIIMTRALRAVIGLYLGSLFWGIVFAVPIRHLLEYPPEKPCFYCLLPVALIGASLAALFGIVVQLIWQEKSITEPMEEPI